MENTTQKATSSRNQATISPAVPRGGILVKVKYPIVKMTPSIVIGTICSLILVSRVTSIQLPNTNAPTTFLKSLIAYGTVRPGVSLHILPSSQKRLPECVHNLNPGMVSNSFRNISENNALAYSAVAIRLRFWRIEPSVTKCSMGISIML